MTHLDKLRTQAALTDNGIRLKQFIPAPRSEVFRAWSRPETLSSFYVPEEWQLEEISIHFRVGDPYRISMSRGSAESLSYFGTYQLIVENQKLVFTEEIEGSELTPTLVELQFEDQEGGCEIQVQHVGLENPGEEAKRRSKWESSLRGLAGLFAKLGKGRP